VGWNASPVNGIPAVLPPAYPAFVLPPQPEVYIRPQSETRKAEGEMFIPLPDPNTVEKTVVDKSEESL